MGQCYREVNERVNAKATMKTLFLLRHAKSSWNDSSLQDFDRPLNVRGLRSAELIGTFIKKQKLSFDLVLSSPAIRARETIEIVLKTSKVQSELRYDQRIYEASPHVLIEVITQIEDEKSKVLLVGHNPGIEKLVEILTGAIVQVATGTFTKIDLKTSKWSKALEAQGNLDWVVKPKELGAVG
jgi:phosphohistidine phosphatase